MPLEELLTRLLKVSFEEGHDDVKHMNRAKYIGTEVHKEAISIAVLDPPASWVMESVIETKANMILQFIQGLKWKPARDFEERGTWQRGVRPAPAAYTKIICIVHPGKHRGRISRDTRRNSQRSGPTCAVRCRGRLPCQLLGSGEPAAVASPTASGAQRTMTERGAARYAAPVKAVHPATARCRRASRATLSIHRRHVLPPSGAGISKSSGSQYAFIIRCILSPATAANRH